MEVFKRPGTRSWYVDLVHPKTGERVKKSLKFEGSKVEAQKRARKLEAELEAGTPETMTVAEALERYVIRSETARLASAKDQRQRIPAIVRLIPPAAPLHELRPSMLVDFAMAPLREAGRRRRSSTRSACSGPRPSTLASWARRPRPGCTRRASGASQRWARRPAT